MTPWTQGTLDDPPFMPALLANLRHAPGRLVAAIAGLTPDELESAPVEGKWTFRKCVQHIVAASIGWTDILYEAVWANQLTDQPHQPDWHKQAEAKIAESVDAAIEVMQQNHEQVIAFVEQFSEEQIAMELEPVQWLTAPYVIKDGVNWGLSLHVDWHLIAIHEKRQKLGKGLDWMANIRT